MQFALKEKFKINWIFHILKNNSTVKVKLQNARRKFGDLMDAGKDSLWFKQIVKNF